MKRYLITALVIAVLLTGCGAKATPDYAMEEAGYAPAAAPEMELYANDAMTDESTRGSSGTGVEAAQQERLVIKNADLRIIVDDPQAKMDEIVSLAKSLDGYVVSSNIYQTYADNGIEVPEGTISIRVPAEKLNDALAQIKAEVVEVDFENVSGEDVTDQYVDLQSRLKAKKAAEEKMLEIMAQARNTEETLAVYSELQIIQSDIEVLTGQINYYERSAAMSSISVSVIASEKSKPIEIGGWKLGETASKSVQKLINYLQGFMRFSINFIIFVLPVLFTIFLPFYLVFIGIRAFLRRRKAKKASKVEAEK